MEALGGRGANGAGGDILARLTYRNLERYSSNDLADSLERIGTVLAERARQFDLFEAVPVREPEPPAAVNEHLATLLSPSQVKNFLDCQARWYFKYVRQLPERTNGKRALGRAVHAAVAENYREKCETKEDMHVTGAIGVFRDAWAAESAVCEFEPKDDPADMKELGEVMVSQYIDTIAPMVEPAAVESPVNGEIGGVPVRGFIDVLDVHGRVIDVKTATKSPNGVRPDTLFQVSTYRLLEPRATGAARIDTLTKTKTVKAVTQTFEVGAADLKYATTIYPLVQAGMRSGIYQPNRNSFFCGRYQCSYWRECQDEFGGSVKGAEE